MTGRRSSPASPDCVSSRGAILLFFIPLAIVRLVLHPFFPQEHNWADFFVQMSFFLFGFILFSRSGFLDAIRRDWRINLGVGIVAATSARWLSPLRPVPSICKRHLAPPWIFSFGF